MSEANPTTTIAKAEDAALQVVPSEDTQAFELAQRKATALAKSSLTPKEFANNVPNCMIAINLSARIGMDPLMVMQNLDVIHGRPSFRASFLIACVNACGRFEPLRYRLTGEGMERTCVAWTRDKDTREEIEGPPVSMQMAKDEAWSTKSGSKWKTMPELMLRYRAAAFFARTVAPEITMGLRAADELDDIHASQQAPQESARSASEALAAAKDVTPEPAPEPDDFDLSPSPDVDPETGETIPDDIHGGDAA